MMIKFETVSGSMYELNFEKSKVRRLIGADDPTPRQGLDGKWKEFHSVAPFPVVVGRPVYFVWHIDIEKYIFQTTKTSFVTKIHSCEESN